MFYSAICAFFVCLNNFILMTSLTPSKAFKLEQPNLASGMWPIFSKLLSFFQF